MDARLIGMVAACLSLGIFLSFFPDRMNKKIQRVFQIACTVVPLSGVFILTHLFNLQFLQDHPASGHECPSCNVFFASEFLLGIGIGLGTGVGVSILFHSSAERDLERCATLVGSMAVWILLGEFLGFVASFMLEDKRWLLAIGLAELTALLPWTCMREISIIADGRAIPCEQDCDTDLALHSYLATLRQLRDQEPRAVEEAVEAPSLEAADIKPDRPDVIEFLARTYPHLSADYIQSQPEI
ncbi:hypothetical protein AAVH_18122 [Aphelenchoides avenae]|nr:hypothetical protein AAVH_18122 [Aphelenchus avenae]